MQGRRRSQDSIWFVHESFGLKAMSATVLALIGKMSKLLKNLSVDTGSIKGVSDRTSKEYCRRATMLTEATGKNLEKSLAMSADRAYLKLRRKYTSVSTLKCIVTMILSVYRHSPAFALKHAGAHEEWMVIHKELSDLESRASDDNRSTDKSAKTMPTPEDIAAALKRLKPRRFESMSASQEYLLIRLLCNHPPKRLDYGDLRVLKSSNTKYDGNYIVLPPKGAVTLVLNRYKTAATLGPFTEEFPRDISTDIRQSIVRFPRDHLFVGKRKNEMSESAFAAFIKQTFLEHMGKEAGITSLRHAYITAHCDPNVKTITELKQIAYSMNHSYEMQQHYRVVPR